jgi:hypothetical protein
VAAACWLAWAGAQAAVPCYAGRTADGKLHGVLIPIDHFSKQSGDIVKLVERAADRMDPRPTIFLESARLASAAASGDGLTGESLPFELREKLVQAVERSVVAPFMASLPIPIRAYSLDTLSLLASNVCISALTAAGGKRVEAEVETFAASRALAVKYLETGEEGAAAIGALAPQARVGVIIQNLGGCAGGEAAFHDELALGPSHLAAAKAKWPPGVRELMDDSGFRARDEVLKGRMQAILAATANSIILFGASHVPDLPAALSWESCEP